MVDSALKPNKHRPVQRDSCDGYEWDLNRILGKGSFGFVYSGWSTDGSEEVAVKVVSKKHFKQNSKVKENLEREIKILELLRGCEYVVHLYHHQLMERHVVLVMELCEFDLDKLLELKKFTENNIILFLHQFTQGMKALRKQNIVHRDLKPGNVLIKRHPTTGNLMIKLADFGYARHFKDENMKPVDLTSIAGTPVFMAPEALDCVFDHGDVKTKYYDDKVDIWSIGALLYKVIVGDCGFVAELDTIGPILKKKGDAIAFTRATTHTTKADYIYELPGNVYKRLSRAFGEKMNKLLRSMLKLDPAERMTFSEFENAVDDIITSKIEIVNLLHGTSMKVIHNPQLTAESLAHEIHSCTHVPPQYQVLFSNSSQYFISPHSTLSPEHFSQLLKKSGGTRGHAKLYLLPINLVESDTLTPDYSCLARLGFLVDDRDTCVSKIIEHKFSDEMVHMIHNMSAQQKSQLEGLKELCTFVSREVTLFGSHGYKQLSEMGHQALAKANLAIQWLQQDLSSLPSKNQGQLGAHLQTVNQCMKTIEGYLDQLDRLDIAADISTGVAIDERALGIESTSSLTQDAKSLPALQREEIHMKCKLINDSCKKRILEVTKKLKNRLHPLWSQLSRVWTLRQSLHGPCSELEVVLKQVSSERSAILRSSLGLSEMDRVTSSGSSPSQVGSHENLTTSMVEALKKENEDLQSQVARLTWELRASRMPSGGQYEEEKTLRPAPVDSQASDDDPENTMKAGSPTQESVSVLKTLTDRLEQCCRVADDLKSGVTIKQSQSSSKFNGEATILYPSFIEHWTDITDEEAESSTRSGALIPRALQLSENLQSVMERLLKTSATNTTISPNSGLVKFARPSEYEEGDIALFHLVSDNHKNKHLVVMHLERPHPYIQMDETSFGNFQSIRPGKMPHLILGRLTEKPRLLKFEDHPILAKELNCSTDEVFFRVKAEATELKFSAPHRTPSSYSLNRTPISRPSNSDLGLLRRKKDSDREDADEYI